MVTAIAAYAAARDCAETKTQYTGFRSGYYVYMAETIGPNSICTCVGAVPPNPVLP